MLSVKCTTFTPDLMSLSLSEVDNPKHLSPLLEFVAKLAPRCVADALMDRFVAADMRHSGRDRESAHFYLRSQVLELSWPDYRP